ncbi:hypothetical protein PVAP13_6KG185730, partial [Panicum virgatum]
LKMRGGVVVPEGCRDRSRGYFGRREEDDPQHRSGRKLLCELCGFPNHLTLDCKRELYWNSGPELCATQVTRQSFFYIDENIDSKSSKDKASTAIITVVKGELSAKMIENEFQRLVSSAQWKWLAKKIEDNKYSMRFPTAKMVMDYSNFTLGVKSVDAQFSIEPWSSSLSAKANYNRHGSGTIAKIGGLVDKTMAIYEGTRFNRDYVRVKIACRNVELVPPSAECTLGMFLYDFFFEREPGPKKQKTDPAGGQKEYETPKNTNKVNPDKGGNDKGGSCKCGGDLVRLINSAQSKINSAMNNVVFKLTSSKENDDSKKVPANDTLSQEETIPAATYDPKGDKNGNEDSYDTSEDSCDYVNEIQKVLGSDAESSKRNEDVFMARCSQLDPTESMMRSATHILKNVLPVENPLAAYANDGSKTHGEGDIDMKNLTNLVEVMKAQRLECRTSERLSKNLKTADICSFGETSKKRNLEGNNYTNSNSFSILSNDELVSRSISMGVNLDVSDYASIDILKNMENARISLINKQTLPTPIDVQTNPPLDNTDVIDLEEDPGSDFDDFILVTPRRSRKPV